MLNPSRIGRENWLDELGSMNNEREIELDEYISCVRKKMATSMEVQRSREIFPERRVIEQSARA